MTCGALLTLARAEDDPNGGAALGRARYGALTARMA